eukprot:CAMPEP_0184980656 /NCGR_PEP_ID=MMETSP1098-20130426/10597_1 /TAXON_ID=89044 /ORGANISM="Spumella elongata, Strain CCAP 955/1" /LENGTH=31 /DNA_ID= /DNA_START= /DNA_END= /DNA_ORIENTATION=
MASSKAVDTVAYELLDLALPKWPTVRANIFT